MLREFDEPLSDTEQLNCIAFLDQLADKVFPPATEAFSRDDVSRMFSSGMYINLARRIQKSESVAKLAVVDCLLFVPDPNGAWTQELVETEEYYGADELEEVQQIKGTFTEISVVALEHKMRVQHFSGHINVNSAGELNIDKGTALYPPDPDPVLVGDRPSLNDRLSILNIDVILGDIWD